MGGNCEPDCGGDLGVVGGFASQPENAVRLERLGVSRTIPRHQYQSKRVAKELRSLLENPQYPAKATKISQIIQTEKGIPIVCNAIEPHLP